jgi:chromosome segregation ATPase
MFVFSKVRRYLIYAGVLSAIAFGAWKYYTYTQEQIRTYAQNAATAELAQRETAAALESTQRDLEQVRQQFDIVSQKFEDAQQRVEVLEEKLSEHEIGTLAQAKPVLVERIVDNATQDVLRCFEILSGSPLTEEERNATRPSEINSSCPDIANPNYRP